MLKKNNISKFLVAILAGFIFTGFLLGCSETTETDTTTYFYIWPDAVTLKVGEERQFYAITVTSGTLNNVDATFSVSGGIGSITSAGVFSAEAVGTGSVIASYVADIATITVTVEAAP